MVRGLACMVQLDCTATAMRAHLLLRAQHVGITVLVSPRKVLIYPRHRRHPRNRLSDISIQIC